MVSAYERGENKKKIYMYTGCHGREEPRPVPSGRESKIYGVQFFRYKGTLFFERETISNVFSGARVRVYCTEMKKYGVGGWTFRVCLEYLILRE